MTSPYTRGRKYMVALIWGPYGPRLEGKLILKGIYDQELSFIDEHKKTKIYPRNSIILKEND